MSAAKRMMANGTPGVQATAINGIVGFGTGVGTAQVGAAPITVDVLIITTSTTGQTAFVLPSDAVPGDSVDIIANSGISASALVYPAVGGTINGGSVNTSITFAASKSATLWCTGPLSWYSNPAVPS